MPPPPMASIAEALAGVGGIRAKVLQTEQRSSEVASWPPRTRAIARAVRIGLSSGAATEEIENLIQTAEFAGLPLTMM